MRIFGALLARTLFCFLLFLFCSLLFLYFIFFFTFLVTPSLIFAIKEDIGVVEAYKKGLKVVTSYFWISILLFLLISGGFLLFIIPGILFLIWFSLADFVLIFEEKKGMDAILRSKFLVLGNFLTVVWRGLALTPIIIPYILLFELQRDGIIGVWTYYIIIGALSLFIAPFTSIYGVLNYKNLKEVKGNIPYKKPSIL